MRRKPKYPALTAARRRIKPRLLQYPALLLALLLCFSAASARAEGPAFPMLTEESFPADDVPAEYLTPAEHPGRVEKVRYVTSDENKEVKSVMVYLPAGYDAAAAPYDVLYILHAASGSPQNYLRLDQQTDFQCLLDHMIESGRLKPLIVVAATYYPSEGFTRFLPLAKQVETAAAFPRELTQDVVPAVETKYNTHAAAAAAFDLAAARDHRAIAGFSLGGVATWYVFLQQMRAFRWFLPISEAGWDDGEGGTSGIWNSDVSAQALHDAVLEQGFGKDDFRLFVATGTEDEAFDVSTKQMISLLEYADLFKPGDNTSCSMMIGGTHTIQALYTYLYHILPALFAEQ